MTYYNINFTSVHFSIIQFFHPNSRNQLTVFYIIMIEHLESFAQFKKCEKHPWRSATFS